MPSWQAAFPPMHPGISPDPCLGCRPCITGKSPGLEVMFAIDYGCFAPSKFLASISLLRIAYCRTSVLTASVLYRQTLNYRFAKLRPTAERLLECHFLVGSP